MASGHRHTGSLQFFLDWKQTCPQISITVAHDYRLDRIEPARRRSGRELRWNWVIQSPAHIPLNSTQPNLTHGLTQPMTTSDRATPDSPSLPVSDSGAARPPSIDGWAVALFTTANHAHSYALEDPRSNYAVRSRVRRAAGTHGPNDSHLENLPEMPHAFCVQSVDFWMPVFSGPYCPVQFV